MKLRYRCLVLDHDDTVVDSTASIHYACFVEYLKKYRPHLSERYSLEEYLRKNFHPGVVEFFREDVGLSAEEMAHEEAYWRDYVKEHIPGAYPGMGALLADFRADGGIIAVSSHSYSDYIRRDYLHNGLPMPDVIYGWDLAPALRKPAPYSLLEIARTYHLRPEQMLMVDDLKPGYDMARAAGVPFAAAGWAYDVPQIADFMRAHCDMYLERVSDLRSVLWVEDDK